MIEIYYKKILKYINSTILTHHYWMAKYSQHLKYAAGWLLQILVLNLHQKLNIVSFYVMEIINNIGNW